MLNDKMINVLKRIWKGAVIGHSLFKVLFWNLSRGRKKENAKTLVRLVDLWTEI
jgi:hypothetical protein